MKKILAVIALIVILASGFWMSSDNYIQLGSISIRSNWGMIGLALGVCFMLIVMKKDGGNWGGL